MIVELYKDCERTVKDREEPEFFQTFEKTVKEPEFNFSRPLKDREWTRIFPDLLQTSGLVPIQPY